MPHSQKPVPNHQSNPNEHILDKTGQPNQSDKNTREKDTISDTESRGRPKPKSSK